jgi:protein gp37
MMADKTAISWTDATWNPITGCTLVDEGCRNCYAAHLSANWPALARHPSRAGLARNNADGVAKFTGEVRFNEQWLDQPLRWKKPRRIFVCAHGDLFHESVPDEWIDRVFAVMALAPHHTFQVLTKRPERAQEYIAAHNTSNPGDSITDRAFELNHKVPGYRGSGGSASWPLRNVWLGTSISDQASADLRIPHLLATPAAIRFISAEPLLGPVSLVKSYMTDAALTVLFDKLERGIKDPRGELHWVITGGESGKHACPAHPDWFRSLRDQCVAAGVPFHFKQWGEWAWAERIEGDPTTLTAYRAGTKRTGHLLDGKAWQQFPGATQ